MNCFIHGQFNVERSYDISEEDLPVLLRQIRPREMHAFGILEKRRGQFVQCYADGRRFVVEWRETQDDKKFDHWRAQDRERLSKLVGQDNANIGRDRAPIFLRYSDTLRIFQDFLRCKSRAARCHWLNINDLLAWQESKCEEREQAEEESRQAAAVLPSGEVLDKILRYETKLERQLFRAMSQLERLQRMRGGETVPLPLTMEISDRDTILPNEPK